MENTTTATAFIHSDGTPCDIQSESTLTADGRDACSKSAGRQRALRFETVTLGAGQERRFVSSMDRMADRDGFVIHGTAVYRPQRITTLGVGVGVYPGHVIGRYLGSVLIGADTAEEVIRRLLLDRCEWCAWPHRAGFHCEADQSTPRCQHAAVTVNCLRCGGNSEFAANETPFCRSCGDADRLAARSCEVGHLLDSDGRCVPCETYGASASLGEVRT